MSRSLLIRFHPPQPSSLRAPSIDCRRRQALHVKWENLSYMYTYTNTHTPCLITLYTLHQTELVPHGHLINGKKKITLGFTATTTTTRRDLGWTFDRNGERRELCENIISCLTWPCSTFSDTSRQLPRRQHQHVPVNRVTHHTQWVTECVRATGNRLAYMCISCARALHSR